MISFAGTSNKARLKLTERSSEKGGIDCISNPSATYQSPDNMDDRIKNDSPGTDEEGYCFAYVLIQEQSKDLIDDEIVCAGPRAEEPDQTVPSQLAYT
jgi:hypothetical protein